MAAGSREQAEQRLAQLERLLRSGPRTAAELTHSLGLSQPTLSRTVAAHSDVLQPFRVRGDRTPKYGMLRKLPAGLPAVQRISRIGQDGSVAHFAEVAFLSGGSTLETNAEGSTLYEGLPPYMAFSAPSGFLGQQIARDVSAEMQFPESLKDWGDDHRIAYLFTRGFNLAGNLVYGEVPLEREMAFRKEQALPVANKLEHYVNMAARLRDAAYGSSAGGEQPKFLSLVDDAGHVIVKFAREGTRMADLLPMEHAALRALEAVGVPAASTAPLAAGGYVFLEVQRFDRIGRNGRVGMLSCGSIDDEFFGRRDSWSEFAARAEKAKYLSSADARNIDVMSAFSELIGNSDRHFENISMLVDDEGEYAGLAPAYDILPMRYASIGGGLDAELKPLAPKIGTIGAKPEVWERAAAAACSFWQRVAADGLSQPVSPAFQHLATQNLAVVQSFVEPLVPRKGPLL